MTKLVIAVMTAALLAACTTTRTLDTGQIEENIAQELEAQTGVVPSSVDCPDEVTAEAGGTFECTATAADGSTATILVEQTDDEGNVTWEVTDAS